MEILFKTLVEVGQRVRPLLLAFFNFVQFFFQASGVLEIENVAEVFHQQIGHDQTDFCGNELATQFLHVLALLDGAENGRVG